MTTYVTIHLQDSGPEEISCEHQLRSDRPAGYPVLCVGDVTIYPTRDRLRRLRDVCAAYLAAHPDPDDERAAVAAHVQDTTGAARQLREIDADERLRSFFAPRGEGGAP